uniref:Uncharacterized protein n=1 Tax=Arundo donax TaxID=35708 RepID=A0A0A8Z8U9_ARUDO
MVTTITTEVIESLTVAIQDSANGRRCRGRPRR